MSEEKKQTSVLGIVGSPRRGGNTDILVDEVLRGAEGAGAKVEKVYLRDLDIRPCLACDSCRKTGKCVQKDDAPALLEQMEHSDVWVLGTPVYFWGPSAQLKALIDRIYVYGSVQYTAFIGRHAILAIPFGDTYEGTARHTEGMLKDTLDYLKVKHVDTILAPGANDRGEIHNFPDVLAAAHRAGKKVADLEVVRN
ncbi:MAG: flavodoxin family protein [Anaerolineaceae bacterium]|nr:flavodoxin family protein [Anaerolineaceae bacterium]